MTSYLDIGEAYFFTLKKCLNQGELVPVDVGSYEKELNRLQLSFIAFEIQNPLDFGWLSDPKIDLTEEKIQKYFLDYLMSSEKSHNEAYRYGNRILEYAQLNECIQKLSKGYTNQASITIAKPSDIELQDPPCLREITFNLSKDHKLNMVVYFRSWDLWGALPLNLSGLTMLQNLVQGFIIGTKLGSMYVAAANAHIYDNMIPLVEKYLKGGDLK